MAKKKTGKRGVGRKGAKPAAKKGAGARSGARRAAGKRAARSGAARSGAVRSPAMTRPAARPSPGPAAGRPGGPRASWLDERADAPVLDRAARQLEHFVAALADGVVDEGEVTAQERRLVKLMKELEPRLSDALHADVTRLLVELTAYDIMRILHELHAARPKGSTVFRG